MHMPFQHPQLDRIHRYTARRLQCQPADVTHSGTTIVVATKRGKTDFMESDVVSDPTLIHLFEYADTSILRTHAEPADVVKIALDALQPAIVSGAKIGRDELLSLKQVAVALKGSPEPYFYLDPADFRPRKHDGVRRLTLDDKPLLDEFHQSIDEWMRWFVEIDHPIVFGLFVEGKLASVASHFLFEEERVAAAGVLTHPEYRQRGCGAAVVSAAVAWALARDWIVEWSTWTENAGSWGLARTLGFRRFSTEMEFRLS